MSTYEQILNSLAWCRCALVIVAEGGGGMAEFKQGQVVRFVRWSAWWACGRLAVVSRTTIEGHVLVVDMAGYSSTWRVMPDEIEPVEGNWWEGQPAGWSFWTALGFEAHLREAFGIEGDPYRLTLTYSHVSGDDRPDWAPKEPHRFVTYIGGEKWFKEEKVVLHPWMGVPGLLAAGYGPESDMVIFVECPKG